MLKLLPHLLMKRSSPLAEDENKAPLALGVKIERSTLPTPLGVRAGVFS
jgi:hypothetical protein